MDKYIIRTKKRLRLSEDDSSDSDPEQPCAPPQKVPASSKMRGYKDSLRYDTAWKKPH